MSCRKRLLLFEEQEGDQVIAEQLRLNLTVLLVGAFMSEEGRWPLAFILIFFAAQTALAFLILDSNLAF